MPSPREKKIEVGERMLLSGAHYPFIYLFIYFFFFLKKRFYMYYRLAQTKQGQWGYRRVSVSFRYQALQRICNMAEGRDQAIYSKMKSNASLLISSH